ncbi:hypothetical protein BU25DRAFT_446449 [Macroventuria anomochaeta]|uniref:Uncharacterized protein n=1 Tax=Macroventuria anomochaeta TaxID=301207 RepID=A0ACB6SA02_9PLEO|nr:uncharacterized protein BU25DRAFT_446449 [Macroventuria anomochaeta]KAF2630873.1 hypothetical protein BU25DRAFT_446449 [Macroventuria anomochaeta]
MSGSAFPHRRQEEVHLFSVMKQPEKSLPIDENWTSCEEVLPHTLFSRHNQHINRDTASDNRNSTSSAAEPRKGPSISVTPPNDSPTAHHVSSSFYRIGPDSTGKALGEIPQTAARSPVQSGWIYYTDPPPSRGRSRSPAGVLLDQYRSLSSSTANRRYGVIDLTNLKNALDDRHPSMLVVETGEQHDEGAMDAGHCSCPDRVVIQRNPEPAQQYQAASDAPPIASDRDHHVPAFLDADNSEVFKRENLQSGDTTISNAITPIGKWRCCECQRGHDIYRFDATEHLISILNCLCKHRSCKSCAFQGNVKRFAPIDDVAGVASVPVAQGDGKNHRFGVVCRTCGLSWRAETVKKPKRHGSLRRRLSILPKKVNPLHKLRHTRSMIHLGLSRDHVPEESRPGTALSTSRSVFNLRSASDPQAKGAKPEEQAQGAEVRFYGIECTCGSVTDSSSICFQVVDVPKVGDGMVHKKQKNVEATKAAEPKSTPGLRVKSHGTPVLHLKGGSHPNPLLSNPVQQYSPP